MVLMCSAHCVVVFSLLVYFELLQMHLHFNELKENRNSGNRLDFCRAADMHPNEDRDGMESG